MSWTLQWKVVHSILRLEWVLFRHLIICWYLVSLGSMLFLICSARSKFEFKFHSLSLRDLYLHHQGIEISLRQRDSNLLSCKPFHFTGVNSFVLYTTGTSLHKSSNNFYRPKVAPSQILLELMSWLFCSNFLETKTFLTRTQKIPLLIYWIVVLSTDQTILPFL